MHGEGLLGRREACQLTHLLAAYQCFFPEHWYKQAGTNIDGAAVGKLRYGCYSNADENTKKLWFVVTTKVAPYVAKEFKGKERQRMTLFSDAVTVQLEAFIHWLLKVCYAQWVEEWRADQVCEAESRATQVRTKPKGRKNFADEHFEVYLKLLEEVRAKRREELTGISWDRAVQQKLQEGAKRTGGLETEGGSSGTKVIKKRRILPIPELQIPDSVAEV